MAQSQTSVKNGSGVYVNEQTAHTTVKNSRGFLTRTLFGANAIHIFSFVLIAALVAMSVGLLVHYYDVEDTDAGTANTTTTSASTITGTANTTTTTASTITTIGNSDNCDKVRERFTEDTTPPLDYRLPRDLLPVHYDIDIRPDFYVSNPTDFKFYGKSTAWLRCNVPTEWVYLHFRKLNITRAEVWSSTTGQQIQVSNTEIDAIREFYKIHLSRALTQGEEISVYTEYTGLLLRDMMGLYYSEYYDYSSSPRVKKYMVGTQFEATDARKAFPCMDEPSFKTTFNVSLWRKEPMIARTNMPAYSTENMTGAGFSGWLRDSFHKTNVKMTTYLVAFLVAEYDFLENVTTNGVGDETPVRIYSRPDALADDQGDYINEVAHELMEYLETYFQFAFPLPKLDHVSIPDFASGAMENWGLITYRESRLIFEPDFCGEFEREMLTVTVAHELAHMWLGDVVTCDWWSHIWIQEGGASYWEHWSTQAVHPNWDMIQIFLARTLYAALRADDNANLHPLLVPTYSAVEAESVFTTISYDKGASIIRMVEHLFLGSTNFKQAMQGYVNTMQYKTATYKDLVNAWEQKSTLPGNNMNSVNLTQAAYTWIEQLGFPIIFINRVDSTQVSITQHMLLEYPERPVKDRLFPSPYQYTWYVPVTYVTNKQPTTMTTKWLQRNNETITLSTALAQTDWILGNYHAYGYYRVNYDDNNWDQLIKQIKNNHLVFDVSNRGQLIHDIMAFGKAGDLDHTRGLQMAEYLRNEQEWLPWYAFDQSQAFIDWVLSDTTAYELYKSYIRRLVLSNYNRLGWVDQPSEPLLTKHLRTLTLNLACVYEMPDCVDKALGLFNNWYHNISNNIRDYTTIRPDIRRSVLCTSIAYSSGDKWDFVFDQYKTWTSKWMGPDGLDRTRFRNALTCSRNPSTLRKYFDLAASEDTSINANDRGTIMTTIATTIIGKEVAWDYLNENWDTMKVSNSTKITILENVVLRFTSKYDKERLLEFFDKHPPTDYSSQDRYDSMIYMVDSNIRWQARNYNDVSSFLSIIPFNKQA